MLHEMAGHSRDWVSGPLFDRWKMNSWSDDRIAAEWSKLYHSMQIGQNKEHSARSPSWNTGRLVNKCGWYELGQKPRVQPQGDSVIHRCHPATNACKESLQLFASSWGGGRLSQDYGWLRVSTMVTSPGVQRDLAVFWKAVTSLWATIYTFNVEGDFPLSSSPCRKVRTRQCAGAR